MELAVDGFVGQQHVALNTAHFAAEDRAALAHGLDVLHEGERVRVVDDDVVDVDGQHLEAGPLQQAADVAGVGQGRDVGGDAAAALLLGELQRRAQLEEGVAAEHGAHEGAVGLQHVVDLGQDAGQVVDPVHAQGGEHEVEGVGPEGQGLLVRQDLPRHVDLAVEGLVGVPVEQGLGGVDG